MRLNSIEAFVPSGADFQASRQLFLELGFEIRWEVEDYIGFANNGCRFILQNFSRKEFAENFMMSVHVGDLDEFWREISAKNLPDKFGIRLSPPTDVPWGREVNLIDIAGVCWHFGEGE